MSDSNQVFEVKTKKDDCFEKDGMIYRRACTTICMVNGETYTEFGEARRWQTAGERSLSAALESAHLSYEDIDGKVSFIV